jgi:hypothetical protein
MSEAQSHAEGNHVDLARMMPLCRALDQLGLRTVAVALTDLACRPYRVGDNVVRKVEYELRRYLRREPADLGRAVACLLLLTLKGERNLE